MEGLDGGGGEEATSSGKKRGPPMTKEEGMAKIRRTIGWYNHNGGLANPIHYRSVKDVFETMNPREALKILNELEQKGSQIRDPTAWLKKAAENRGPELDLKVRRTIAWYNKSGNLQEQINYTEVREALSWLSTADACRLLAGLDGKEAEIQKPTAWLCKATWNKLNRDGPSYQPVNALALQDWQGAGAGAGGSGAAGGGGGAWSGAKAGAKPAGSGGWNSNGSLDPKVKKTIGWYNKNGGLQGEIRFDEVSPLLAQVGTAQALKILEGLDPEKGGNSKVKNPTGWIKKAAQNLLG